MSPKAQKELADALFMNFAFNTCIKILIGTVIVGVIWVLLKYFGVIK